MSLDGRTGGRLDKMIGSDGGLCCASSMAGMALLRRGLCVRSRDLDHGILDTGSEILIHSL